MKKQLPPQPTHSNFYAFAYIWGIIVLVAGAAILAIWNYAN